MSQPRVPSCRPPIRPCYHVSQMAISTVLPRPRSGCTHIADTSPSLAHLPHPPPPTHPLVVPRLFPGRSFVVSPSLAGPVTQWKEQITVLWPPPSSPLLAMSLPASPCVSLRPPSPSAISGNQLQKSVSVGG